MSILIMSIISGSCLYYIIIS